MEEAELRDFFDTFFGTAAVLCSYVSFLYFGSQNNLGRYTVYIYQGPTSILLCTDIAAIYDPLEN